ncbi:uncharacterized protein K460DRAFT_68263 [Cucurbitaria berberidis CBS 394.84]|uniref:DUF7730 domain-containing protein n=1 Tax=Cucurbitaria berberidis CBS 394.84 TaxID=1168544 RepID=A0A9P4GM64_9PLEO|nr:uncharacterized protein K460DRAFT_68263 [Cucurbitaria berberidis CBS 394.84]KAF1848130.1 hypothetical protein K460DRAFT_68263 [Cucurbitaria berberidis CBS 394.84]
MRAFIVKKLKERKMATTATAPCSTSAASCTAPRPDLPRSSAHTQRQCAVFNTLSAELRLLIYHAALADSRRLLHFLHVTPYKGEPRPMGHWRCEDRDSPYPIWQHRCFGCWAEDNTRWHRKASHTNSDLISLLLTCRLIYSEAVEVLYAENHFSFRGARGVVKFQNLIAPPSWHALRYVHISTTFLTPMKHWKRGSLPPENYDHWESGCHALSGLRRLQLLSIDMIVWDQLNHENTDAIEHQSLIYIFGALKAIRARTFQIELNIKLPDQVKNSLGPVPFEILYHERPYDRETFPL